MRCGSGHRWPHGELESQGVFLLAAQAAIAAQAHFRKKRVMPFDIEMP